jgi:hypothetical protein
MSRGFAVAQWQRAETLHGQTADKSVIENILVSMKKVLRAKMEFTGGERE